MQVFFTPILTVGMSSKPIVGVANRVHYVFLCSLCVKQFSARWGVEVPPTFRSLLPLPEIVLKCFVSRRFLLYVILFFHSSNGSIHFARASATHTFTSTTTICKKAFTVIAVFNPDDPLFEREAAAVAAAEMLDRQVLTVDSKAIRLS